MKKKISLIIAVLVFMLSFTGCKTAAADQLQYSEETIVEVTGILIDSFSQMTAADMEYFIEGSEADVSQVLSQTGLPVEYKAFIEIMKSWQGAESECGTYKDRGEAKIIESAKEIQVEYPTQFEERDAKIVFVINSKMQVESMTVEAKYSMGEIMKKSLLNTVLGMGTVFIMLIFIAFVISLFKFIPAIQAKFSKKATPPVQIEAVKTETAATTSQAETALAASADDQELVAVIAAAIAASEGVSTDDFVVRSIRRRQSNKWI